ncbi:MAG: RraA family protein [Acidobacteriota bacterium]|nr:RraA family protein [Acidobacteriota bacterium]
MPEVKTVPPGTIESLQKYDTCTISNAIERFNVRLRNEGFMNNSVKCCFPQFAPKAGYAVTGRIRSSSTPISGRCYYEAMDWWHYLLTIPAPRFVVIEDADHGPGIGAFIGEIHANIAVAMGCAAFVTNGSVRDIPAVEASGLQVFAGSVSVSHAYAHVIDFGEPIEVAGLRVKSGDLLQGDRHGVHLIPTSIAKDLARTADELLREEKTLVDFCRSPEFSVEKLGAIIERKDRAC